MGCYCYCRLDCGRLTHEPTHGRHCPRSHDPPSHTALVSDSSHSASATRVHLSHVYCTRLLAAWTIPVAGELSASFPGIQEWKISGIPGRPWMQTLMVMCAQVLSTLQTALPSHKGNVTLATSADSRCSSEAIFVCQLSSERQDWRSRWISTSVRCLFESWNGFMCGIFGVLSYCPLLAITWDFRVIILKIMLLL